MAKEKKQAILLMGPTACGKTDAALWLAKQLPIDIISVDSAMIYRGMDIGTGKPDKKILQQYPHRLVDIIEPDQSYSVGQFLTDVKICMEQAWKQNRIPLLVGGTMMYFNTLLKGMSVLPPADQKIRDKIEKEALQYGWDALYQELLAKDPKTAERIHPNDPQRLQRAIEVMRITNKPMSDSLLYTMASFEDWDFLSLSLICERSQLHQRIAERFSFMLEQGFIEEVQMLQIQYALDEHFPAYRAVGYRQVIMYLNGIFDYQTMIEKSVIATRQLAKRQCTWLRSFETQSINILQSNWLGDLHTVIKNQIF